MIRKNLLPLLCLLIAFSACKKNNSAPDTGIELNLTPTEQQKVLADNSFSLKLFKTVSATGSSDINLMLSPLSVSFAIAMTNNGSNGQTLADINSAMNFNGFTQDQVNSYYNKLITGLPKVDPATTLTIANSIWINQSFTVLPQFIQTNINYYQAKVQPADFGSPATKDMINQWVSNQTNGKIPAIINQTTAADAMYLINAIYFKGMWNTRFDVSATHKQTFYLANNTSVQTDFMSSKIAYNGYSDNNEAIFELPYHDNKYSMVIVMPINGASVQSVASTLDSAKWQTWMSKLSATSGQLIIPKFKFSYGLSLNNTLAALGMGSAFSGSADFSRISATAGLHITDVEHKAYIEVNEDGTEAAAATSVTIGFTAAPLTYSTVDHPFIFAIREVNTGLILFTGVVNNPQLTGM